MVLGGGLHLQLQDTIPHERADVFVRIPLELVELAVFLLLQFLNQTSDYLTTFQACSFILTTISAVLGQRNHQKTVTAVPEKQHDLVGVNSLLTD
jgi:hypothetical protein